MRRRDNVATRLAALERRLAPQGDPRSGDVKQTSRDAAGAAISRSVFGVPTFEVDGRLFWGVDSIEMVAAYLHGDPWFNGPAWQAPQTTIAGVVRTRPIINH